MSQLTYLKTTVCAMILGIGIFGGMYLGHVVTAPPNAQYQSRRLKEEFQPPSWVKFGPGDAFPIESVTFSDGAVGTFEELLRDRESIVIFADWNCEACLDLLRYVHGNMLSRLNAGVQTVLVSDRASGSPPIECSGLVSGLKWVRIDGKYWETTYHTVLRPILVGVDNSGIVLHVQFAYDGFIDRELVSRFYRSGN